MILNELIKPIEYNSALNPKLWDGEKLREKVKRALIKIAKDFITFTEHPIRIKDICIAGSNANYTYTDKSDIDLHIIADYTGVECGRSVEELIDTKVLLYRQKHNITVEGIPVEIYVENVEEPAVSADYSLVYNKWIKKPKKQTVQYDKKKLNHMIKVYKTLMQHAVRTGDLQTCRNVVKLLRAYRTLGLLRDPSGEFGIPNLVYKSLRNDNSLKALTTFIEKLHDNSLSI